MKKKKIILFSIGVVMLIFGLLLYLLLNRKVFVSEVLLRVISIHEIESKNLLVNILRGYGADLLWSASFTMIVQFIVWCPKKKTALLVVCSFLGIAYELLQHSGLVTGVADFRDVIAYMLGSLLAILIILGGKFYEEESSSGSSNGS